MWEPAFDDNDVPEAPAWTPKVEVGGALESPLVQVQDSPCVSDALAWIPSPSSPASAVHHAAVNAAPGAIHNLQVHSWQTRQINSLWRVAHECGVSLRSGPGLDAPFTGCKMEYNEIFQVSEEIQAPYGCVSLRIADGRGWTFDDSALAPNYPSVVRGTWVPVCTSSVTPSSYAIMSPSLQSINPAAMSPSLNEPSADTPRTKHRRSRKRGGVKRNKKKNKKQGTAPGFSSDSGAGAETEIPSDAGLQEKEEDSDEDRCTCENVMVRMVK